MVNILKIDTNFLYKEKERINKMIEGFFHEQNFQEKLNAFEKQSFIYKGKDILIEMGKVLREFTVKYLNDNPGLIKEEEKKDFVYYFWPGFSTIENKRISIWGAETKESKSKYTTGVGWTGWNKNIEEFRNCPATIAYEQVLNNENFDGCNFFPGSTHHFRVNQSKENDFGKSYLKLRIGEKGDVFKALHITTDEQYKKDESVVHTLLITIPQTEINEIGSTVQKQLNLFLEYNRTRKNNEERDKYLWEWPFNVLPYEEKFEKRKNKSESIIELCKKAQKSDIEIQTHLYSFWIAETLGMEDAFDDTCKKTYRKKLQQLIENRRDKLYWYEKLDLLDDIDAEKKRVENISKSSTDPESQMNSYKKANFNHWYTLYHEGVTVKEDLGSTMFLTSHPLPLELISHVASWIEDIYNNLKLVESKAIAQYKMRKDDFSRLYHIQGHYFTLFADYLEKKACSELISTVNIMDTTLRIIRNIFDHEKLKKDIYYEDTKDNNINIINVLNKSIIDVNSLCKNVIFLKGLFRINDDDHRASIKKNAQKDELFKLNQSGSINNIESHEQLLVTLINEILINAVKHSNVNEPPYVNIFVCNNENITLKFQNSTYINTQEELDRKMKNSDRFGLKMCETVAKALNIEYKLPLIDNNKVTVELIIYK